ncbi:MAG: signal peptidase I [Bellilinea sp.]
MVENPYQNFLESPEEQKPQRNSTFRLFLEILQTLALAVVLYFLIDLVIARVRVENISMLPTLQPGEFVLVNKMAYQFGDFDRGDIVVFHYSEQEDYIKRVIGLPGDQIEISNGEVRVNDQLLAEPYISAAPQYNGSWEVPPDNLFVLGDNRNQSSDSHRWGYINEESVVGEAMVVYWPLDEFQILSQPVIVKANN